MFRQLVLRYRWTGVFLLVALFSALGVGGTTWALPVQAPQRQTVPLTPPPTWTRVRPPATRTLVPTRPEPPRSATPGSPSTPVPQATSVPAGAPPSGGATPVATPRQRTTPQTSESVWLWLSADPLIVGPGSRVSVRVELKNVDATALDAVTLELPAPVGLRFVDARVASGQADISEAKLTWQLGRLEPGTDALIEVTARVAADVLPDGALLLRPRLSWSEGELLGDEMALVLPWALLPATGP
jgi:hypothetical protein